MESCSQSEIWIHVLFKGEQQSQQLPETTHSNQGDEYVKLFASKNCIAINVPLLQFRYQNINKLVDIFLDACKNGTQKTGLIITSPRVVDAIEKALDLCDIAARARLRDRLNSELVFVIGDKTATLCGEKLNLNYNLDSPQAGNVKSLSELIHSVCSAHDEPIKLIYPKGSLADETIERSISSCSNTIITTSIVYETSAINHIPSALINKLIELKLDAEKSEARRAILNLVFFSPSGVYGFAKCPIDELTNGIRDVLKHLCYNESLEIEYRFSSIGKTTEAALASHGYPVFIVAPKPNATSLLDSILHKIAQVKEDDRLASKDRGD